MGKEKGKVSDSEAFACPHLPIARNESCDHYRAEIKNGTLHLHINSLVCNGKRKIQYIPCMTLIIIDIQEDKNNFDTNLPETKYIFDAVTLKYW